MNFFSNIRIRIHEQLLRNELPQARQVGRKSVSLEAAKTVGILFDGTEPENREMVLSYAKKLKNQGKKVKLLAYFDNKLESDNFTFAHFNNKKLDWALRPKTAEVEAFYQQPFDLLLNLSCQSLLPLEYIAARSKARFRVGPTTEKTFCYDLMLEHDSRKNLKNFTQQIERYLQPMQPGSVAAAV